MIHETLHLPPCQSREAEKHVRSVTRNRIARFLDDTKVTGCPKECNATIYSLLVARQPIQDFYAQDDGDEEAKLFLFVSNEVEVAEEYLLFDGNAIVSAVGGSLGLFLGVSCLSVLTMMGKKIALLFKRKTLVEI